MTLQNPIKTSWLGFRITRRLFFASQFQQSAKLRSNKEVLDQADFILRLDWACYDARLAKKPIPGNLSTNVVLERHHSFNWLIRYENQEWDDVSTDT
jgi:hypothetical protein